MGKRTRFTLAAALACAAIVVADVAAAHPIHLPTVEAVQLVVDGVDNPRSLVFSPEGDLYIAAAGRGGMDACTTNEQGLFCNGLTGAVLKVAGQDIARVPLVAAQATPVVDRLISMAYPGGSVAHGVHGVTMDRGEVYVVFMGPELVGTGSSEACCQDSVQGELLDAAQSQLGNLMRVGRDGELIQVADVDHFEYSENPINGPTSNPYALIPDGGGSFLIVDAAGNTIVRAHRSGRVSLFATLDNIRPGDENTGVEAVPTGIAKGPDGNYYVSLLAGFHPGFARILQITPSGVTRIVADGLSMLTGIAVAPGGTIYATSFSDGALVRVRPDPERAGKWLPAETLYRGELVTPTAVAVGPDGWLYVSDGGALPDQPVLHGRIVRVPM